jgi:hypothetical protein
VDQTEGRTRRRIHSPRWLPPPSPPRRGSPAWPCHSWPCHSWPCHSWPCHTRSWAETSGSAIAACNVAVTSLRCRRRCRPVALIPRMEIRHSGFGAFPLWVHRGGATIGVTPLYRGALQRRNWRPPPRWSPTNPGEIPVARSHFRPDIRLPRPSSRRPAPQGRAVVDAGTENRRQGQHAMLMASTCRGPLTHPADHSMRGGRTDAHRGCRRLCPRRWGGAFWSADCASSHNFARRNMLTAPVSSAATHER